MKKLTDKGEKMKYKRGVIHTVQLTIRMRKDQLFQTTDLTRFKVGKSARGNDIYRHFDRGIKTTIVIVAADKRTNFYDQAIIYIILDLYKLTGLDYVTENHIDMIQQKMDEYLFDLFELGLSDTKIHNVDFSFDFVFDPEQIALFLKLYRERTMDFTHRYLKDTSTPTTYFNSCSGKCKKKNEDRRAMSQSKVLRVYDKHSQSKSPSDKKMLRFEVALKNRHLNYRKNRDGMEKKLDQYLDEEIGLRYFINEFSKVIFAADFCSVNEALDRIRQSSFTSTMKMKLEWFITLVERESLQSVQDHLKKYKLTEYKIREYIRMLEKINVNPLCLPKHDTVHIIINPVRQT